MKVKKLDSSRYRILLFPWAIFFWGLGWTLKFLGELQELKEARNQARDEAKWAT